MKRLLTLLLLSVSFLTYGQTTLPSGSKVIGNVHYQAPDGRIYLFKGIQYLPNAYFEITSRPTIDSLLALKADKTISISAGTGLSGGGNLSASRTISADTTVLRTVANSLSKAQIQTALNTKQATLVSGTNLKTVNGSSLLGSGDLTISGGGSSDAVSQAFIPNAANVVMSGDSYTVGGVGPTSVNNSHPYILKSRYNFTLENLAQNGTGVFQAIKNLYANSTAIPTADDAFFFMSGFNDLRRGGSATPTLEKIKGAARVYFANAFAKSVTIANDAAVTKSGTWSTTNAATVPAKAIQQYANSVVYSSSVGATLTYAFSGDNMFVSILGVDGAAGFTGGTVTITVDGVLKETFVTQGKSDGLTDALSSTNQFSPNGIYIKGLGDGSHTCVLAVSALPASGVVYVDYFGTLDAPINSKPVLVGNYQYMNATGYTLGTPFNNASDAVMDSGNAALQSVIDEFPYYPVYLADVNAVFNTATHVAADNIHPNNEGAKAIANVFSELITPSAKSPNIAGFVPYSGATGAVDLNTKALTVGAITASADATINGITVGRGGGSGANNVAIGSNALLSMASSSNSVAIGVDAMRNSTAGGIAIGPNALKANTTGTNNTAIGDGALTVSNGNRNTAISRSLGLNTSGSDNVAIGYGAAAANTSGGQSVAIGVNALEGNTTGTNNVVIGYLAITGNVSNTVALGWSAGRNNAGSNNTFLGQQTGFTGTSVSGQVMIGYQAGYSETVGNKFYLSNSATNDLITGDFATATKHVKFYGGISIFRRAIADAAATIAKSDYLIAYTSLTATRAVTLPTASTVSGAEFIIKDEAGTAGTNAITIVGTVNGVANPTAVNTNYGVYRLYSNGTAWFTL